MKKWIEMLSLAALSLGLLTSAPTFAQGYYNGSYDACDPCVQPCEPCDPCVDPCCYDPCCFGGFSVGVDFIYWKPCVADLDYAAEISGGGVDGISTYDVHYKRVCLDWEPGFRVRIAKPDLWNRWSLMASYTWLNVKDHNSTSATAPDYIVSPLVHAHINEATSGLYSEIEAHYKVNYQSWDILAAYPCEFCNCNLWIPFIGVEGFHLDQKLSTDLFNPSTVNGGFFGETEWKSDFHAVGLKVGQDYEFRFCDCFKFFSRGSVTLAVAEPDSKYYQFIYNSVETGGEEFDVNDDLCCQLIPGFHIQLGVAYESCFCNFDYSVRLGYEFLKWFNLPNARRFPGREDADIAISSQYDTRSLGFHGLLAGLDVKF